jgi:hypothetical protein
MSRLALSTRATPFFYAAAAVAVIFGVAVLYARGVLTDGQIGTSLLAMLGTFLGALFAFRLNERKEDIKLAKQRREDLNSALFVLARQINAVAALHRDLSRFNTEFERAFNCPAFRPPTYEDVAIDFGALGFALESHPSLLMKISLEEEGFHQAMRSLNMRNDFYVDELQPVVAAKGLNRQNLELREIQVALGERLTQGAFNLSRVMYHLIREADASLPLVHAELYNAAKELYPNAQFVKLTRRADDAV